MMNQPSDDNEQPYPRRKAGIIGNSARLFLPLGLLAVVILAGSSLSVSAQTGASPKTPAAISVAAAKAAKQDIPIYIDALGSVVALNTVTVRSRVDGELQKIHFTEGQIIKAGDPLADIDPRPFQVQLLQAEGQLARDAALLKNAHSDFDRYTAAREAVTQQQIDTAAANVAQYEGAVKTDEAAIANARLQLTYCHITAPINGTVGLRLVDQGNIIHASDSTGLVVITQQQPISVVFNIPQVHLPKVIQAMGGEKLTVEAYSDDFSRQIATGKVAALDNQIDPATLTLKIKSEFENKDRALYPNQFVNARLVLGSLKDAIVIPTAAVQRSPDASYAYVIKQDNTVEMRILTLGIGEGAITVVEKGLSPGEMVVTDGVDKLQNGSKVHVRKHSGKNSSMPDDDDTGMMSR